ncbi:MAG: hypothetical protein JO288_19775 [Hyphomicrobiales bacterium]|nr:hypothetical protein [Hyphomicrobiales bacterium]
MRRSRCLLAGSGAKGLPLKVLTLALDGIEPGEARMEVRLDIVFVTRVLA